MNTTVPFFISTLDLIRLWGFTQYDEQGYPIEDEDAEYQNPNPEDDDDFGDEDDYLDDDTDADDEEDDHEETEWE